MKKNILLAFFAILLFGWVACKSEDKPAIDQESEDAIKEMLDHEAEQNKRRFDADSALIRAYKEDKTTISVEDIDYKDTTYSARLKNLYKNDKNEKMAAVFGLKSKGRLGVVVIQKEGEKSERLPQTKFFNDGKDAEFSNGSTKLTTNGDNITISKNGESSTFSRIK